MFQYWILESVAVYCCRPLSMFQYYILESIAVYCCRPLSIFQMNALAPISWAKLNVAAGLELELIS
jgi:hypothetical protein